jgi:DNA-binding transcriptional ArsR family regulator
MPKIRDIIREVRAARGDLITSSLALEAGLTGDARTAFVDLEHDRQADWDAGMAWRLAMDGWAEVLMLPAERDEHRRKAADRERRYLQQHLDAVKRRATLDGKLAKLALDGERVVYWALGDSERHCAGCLRMGNRLWPLETVARVGPSICHHGCRCDILSPTEAAERGLPIRRGRQTPTAGESMGLMEALRLDGPEYAAIADVGAGIPPEVRARVQRRLRETLVIETLQEAQTRVRSYMRNGHRVRSYIRDVAAHVPEVAWPKTAESAATQFHKAITDQDPKAADDAIEELSRVLGKKKDDTTRRQVLRSAQQIRAALVNPHNLPVEPGTKIPTSGGKVHAPLMVHNEGITDPWAAGGEFPWRLDPAWFNGEAGAEKIAAALQKSGFVDISRDDAGRIIATPKTAGANLRSSRRKIARALELNEPRLRQLRYDGEGGIVDDARPLDVGDDEPLASELNRATMRHEKGIRKTLYPNVTGRQLGDAAETILDGVAGRMSDLGLSEEGATAEHPAGERGDAQSPVDWVIGDRAIEVKAISLRSASLAPYAPGPALTIDLKDRTSKVAYAKRHGLKPAMVVAVTDLDSNRAFTFLMEYDPANEDDWFRSKRLPASAVAALLSGEAQAGDEFRSRQGDGAPTTYLGQDRLGFNPLSAADVEASGLRSEQVANARERVRRTRQPARVARAPKTAPAPARPPRAPKASSSDTPRAPAVDKTADIAGLYRQGYMQREIVEMTGLSQSGVSRTITALRNDGKLPEIDREAQVRRLAAEGLDIEEIARRVRLSAVYIRDILAGEPA